MRRFSLFFFIVLFNLAASKASIAWNYETMRDEPLIFFNSLFGLAVPVFTSITTYNAIAAYVTFSDDYWLIREKLCYCIAEADNKNPEISNFPRLQAQYGTSSLLNICPDRKTLSLMIDKYLAEPFPVYSGKALTYGAFSGVLIWYWVRFNHELHKRFPQGFRQAR